MTGARLVAAGAGGVAALICVTGVGAASPRRPDLVETALVVSQPTIERGGTLEATHVVRNRGHVVASASRTGFYLSLDRTRDDRDVRLGRRQVPRLTAGAAVRLTTSLPVPASTPAGSYRVLACADDLDRIRETSEHGNCRASRASVAVTAPTGDTTPPTFAGLESATTCIPGPTSGDRSAPFHLTWTAANDDVTPTAEIVYLVYASATAGGESFATPTYVSQAGATTLVTPPLPADKPYSFVVRALDAAGNADANRVEQIGKNICE